MSYLEFVFEEKLEIKEAIEKYCYSKRNEDKFHTLIGLLEIDKVFDLLKGSLSIDKKNIVENLLRERMYYYEVSGKEYKARCFYIGKAIIILAKDRNIILEFIPLNDFDYGINKYKNITEETEQKTIEYSVKIKEKLKELTDKFQNLGKWDKIEKGKILEEIDILFSENKELGKKTDMWEKLGILSSDKSMLCKRYKLFKEFQEYEASSEHKDHLKIIERMTDSNLKKITKGGLLMEEKVNMLEKVIKGETV